MPSKRKPVAKPLKVTGKGWALKFDDDGSLLRHLECPLIHKTKAEATYRQFGCDIVNAKTKVVRVRYTVEVIPQRKRKIKPGA